jgi:hypothetical protein
MKDYTVAETYEVSDVHEIVVEYDGYSYIVIFGKHVNGGFYCILNWGVSGELASFQDTFWNTESIARNLKKKKVATVIAMSIAEYHRRISRARGEAIYHMEGKWLTRETI